MVKMAVLRTALARVARDARHVTSCPLAGACTRPVATRALQLQTRSVRGFGSKGINGINGVNGVNGVNGKHHDDADDWEDADSDLSPFERLLQHSKQFRDEVGLEELPEDIESEFLEDEVAEELVDEQPQEDSKDLQEDEEPKANAYGHADDLEDALDEREADHAEFVGQIRRPHGTRSVRADKPRHHNRQDDREFEHDEFPRRRFESRREIEYRVRREIANAEDVDFEHGLRDLDEHRAKDKMYTQLIMRSSDRDMVCQNCGEPGHVARNCMLPTICSACGDVGHRQNECPHRRYDERQVALAKKLKTFTTSKPVDKKKMASERRRLELEAIRERHERMKSAFDAEIDDYVDRSEAISKARKERARKATEEES